MQINLSDMFGIAGWVISAFSAAFAVYTYFNENSKRSQLEIEYRAIKRNIESGLIGLIGQLDKINIMEIDTSITRKHICVAASYSRDHAISLLRSFSEKSERHQSYDFGIKEVALEEIIAKRQKITGIGVDKGCIFEKTELHTPHGTVLASDIEVGDKVLSFNGASLDNCTILNKTKHQGSQSIVVNKHLSLTPDHLVYVGMKGWVPAKFISVGDILFDCNLDIVSVYNVDEIDSDGVFYKVETEHRNLFAGGFLVHNEKCP
ncbi:Hint domain-containing protein [Woodsholea maritima]|uniref:Hint domain-containing protein n=1 Tax=Woodsholea maritima TaxID=240237 RepID=UPI00036A07DF|nr:Hint domain-containing protein [Woodsholea maritima]